MKNKFLQNKVKTFSSMSKYPPNGLKKILGLFERAFFDKPLVRVIQRLGSRTMSYCSKSIKHLKPAYLSWTKGSESLFKEFVK